MTTTESEITFFWHCQMAAKVFDEFPENTVTKGHFVHAVRMATVCAAGRQGVQYASDGARSIQILSGKQWDKCGLIKEHVVPVSIIRALVYEELKATAGSAPLPQALLHTELPWLTPEVKALFLAHPRA